MCDGNDEETVMVKVSLLPFTDDVSLPRKRADVPVAVVRDTGQSVVPRQEGRQKTEKATGLDDRWVRRAFGVAVEVADAEQEESHIEGEEEEKEGDRRTEGEEEEDSGKDEPTLGRRILSVTDRGI